MENRNKVILISELNEVIFQSSLQRVFDELSETYNIEVQYQIKNKQNNVFYTALVIARRK